MDQILATLQTIVNRINFKHEANRAFLAKVQDFGLCIKSFRHPFTIVRWKASEIHFTLNVDGASKGNLGAAGGAVVLGVPMVK